MIFDFEDNAIDGELVDATGTVDSVGTFVWEPLRATHNWKNHL